MFKLDSPFNVSEDLNDLALEMCKFEIYYSGEPENNGIGRRHCINT